MFAWHPLVGHGGHLIDMQAIKSVPSPVEFIIFDHFTYQAIARTVEDGGSAYVEPFTGTGTSIYPSGYYWFVGTVAKLTGVSVVAIWNAFGIVIALGLTGASFLWARWTAPGTRAYVLAAVPLFVGTLGWWAGGDWLGLYNENSVVLWAPYTLLAMGTGEAFSMLVLALVVLGVAGGLTQPGTRAGLLSFAAAGVGLGVLMHTHSYVTIFAAFTVVFMLVTMEAVHSSAWRWLAGWSGVCGVLLGLFGLGVIDLRPTTQLALLAAVPALALVTRPSWTRRMWAGGLALIAPFILIAGPMVVRLAREMTDSDSFFNVRQEQSAVRDLGMPFWDALWFELPVLVLAVAAAAALFRSGLSSERHRAWFAALSALLVSTSLLTFNDLWGVDQEPYRFLPYGAFMLAIVAFPWLWLAVADGTKRSRIVAGTASVLMLATIPTTVAYSRAIDGSKPYAPSGTERAAYGELAKITGNGLTLLDACFWPELTRVVGGPHTIAFHPGLAYPEHVNELVAIKNAMTAGELAPPDQMAAAGIAWFATHTNCGGVPANRIAATLGPPTRTFPMPTPEAFGHPAGTRYELYRMPNQP